MGRRECGPTCNTTLTEEPKWLHHSVDIDAPPEAVTFVGEFFREGFTDFV